MEEPDTQRNQWNPDAVIGGILTRWSAGPLARDRMPPAAAATRRERNVGRNRKALWFRIRSAARRPRGSATSTRSPLNGTNSDTKTTSVTIANVAPTILDGA